MFRILLFSIYTQIAWIGFVLGSFTRRMDLQADFCESSISDNFIFNQIQNTMTSFSYILVAQVIAILMNELMAATFIFLIGISSAAYHGYVTSIAGFCDFTSILVYFSFRLSSYSKYPNLFFGIILVCSWILVYLTVPWVYSIDYDVNLPRVDVTSAIVLILLIVATLGVEFYQKPRYTLGWVFTLITLLLAVLFWVLGRTQPESIWCSSRFSLGHMFWHIFSSLALGFFEWTRFKRIYFYN